MLNIKGVDLFNSWFLREYSACITEPSCSDILTVACFNRRYGVLITSFGYDFVRPFLDGSLHLSLEQQEDFEKNCPLDYRDLETLNGLIHGHLGSCEYCRHINSVHVFDHLSATQPAK